MSISPIINLSSTYLQSLLGTTQTGTTNTNQTSGTWLSTGGDNSQLSPFAQLMSTLQQLEQSNPTQYQQVTAQIATNLNTAAQTAQSDGYNAAANQLTQLANDFTSASQNGQLPNIQDLAQAAAGGHHHHHHFTSDWQGSNTDSNSNTNQLSQSSGAQHNFNPLSIIMNTLDTAGVTDTSS